MEASQYYVITFVSSLRTTSVEHLNAVWLCNLAEKMLNLTTEVFSYALGVWGIKGSGLIQVKAGLRYFFRLFAPGSSLSHLSRHNSTAKPTCKTRVSLLVVLDCARAASRLRLGRPNKGRRTGIWQPDVT